MRYEYIRCVIQQGRATWANDQWLGTRRPEDSSEKAALASCPKPWEFLAEKGNAGWELVAATSAIVKGEITGFFADQLDVQQISVLYLKRCAD